MLELEHAPVVLELGTSTLRAGLAGDVRPRVSLRSPPWLCRLLRGSGDSSPADCDLAAACLSSLISRDLGVRAWERKVVVLASPAGGARELPGGLRRALARALCAELRTPALSLLAPGAAATLGSGLWTAIVVDVGMSESRVISMLHGRLLTGGGAVCAWGARAAVAAVAGSLATALLRNGAAEAPPAELVAALAASAAAPPPRIAPPVPPPPPVRPACTAASDSDASRGDAWLAREAASLWAAASSPPDGPAPPWSPLDGGNLRPRSAAAGACLDALATDGGLASSVLDWAAHVIACEFGGGGDAELHLPLPPRVLGELLRRHARAETDDSPQITPRALTVALPRSAVTAAVMCGLQDDGSRSSSGSAVAGVTEAPSSFGVVPTFDVAAASSHGAHEPTLRGLVALCVLTAQAQAAEVSLPACIADALRRAPVDARRVLARNVVLCGGLAGARGFPLALLAATALRLDPGLTPAEARNLVVRGIRDVGGVGSVTSSDGSGSSLAEQLRLANLHQPAHAAFAGASTFALSAATVAVPASAATVAARGLQASEIAAGSGGGGGGELVAVVDALSLLSAVVVPPVADDAEAAAGCARPLDLAADEAALAAAPAAPWVDTRHQTTWKSVVTRPMVLPVPAPLAPAPLSIAERLAKVTASRRA